MTNLKALTVAMKDADYKIMSEPDYKDQLEFTGIDPDGTFDSANPGYIYLVKADILESIVTHPLKWNSYKQGDVSEDMRPELLLKEAEELRKRYTVIGA